MRAGDEQSGLDKTSSSWIFAGIVTAFCIWVLSLPVFPTQDGAMHRYYSQVMGGLLLHHAGFEMYQIRHPFPPYATHYVSLLLLSRFLSYDLAEKLFVCLALVCFAYGLRFAATSAGPSGKMLSLLVAPLLLPWSLWMGFYNFYLAMGLALLSAGVWCRASYKAPRLWWVFGASIFLLAFTHPVPLLLLLAVCGLDLLLGSFRRRHASPAEWLRANRARLAAFIFLCAAFAFPASLVDKQHAASALQSFGIHPHFLSSAALLFGVSPYNTRSHSLWINTYRIALYLLLIFWSFLAVRAFRRTCKNRDFGLGSVFFVAVGLLGLALLVLPDSVNGSLYFATRLVSMLWIGSLVAASAWDGNLLGKTGMATAAVVLTVVTLISAELYIRPAANDLSAEETQLLPQGKAGVLLMGYGLSNYVRFDKQLAFDPYQWGTALAAVHAHSIVLDSPWMDQNITPIAPVPGSLLTVDDVADSPFTRVHPPARFGRSLRAITEASAVRASSYILYAGTPAELSQGLKVQLDPDEAALFTCTLHGWYLACLRKGMQTDEPS